MTSATEFDVSAHNPDITSSSVKNLLSQKVARKGPSFRLRNCTSCGGSLGYRSYTARICWLCFREKERAYSREYARRRPLAVKAHAKVATAISRGDLPQPRELLCADCAKPASCYDHRDYRYPLLVQPVCGSCNKLRGPAAPYINN